MDAQTAMNELMKLTPEELADLHSGGNISDEDYCKAMWKGHPEEALSELGMRPYGTSSSERVKRLTENTAAVLGAIAVAPANAPPKYVPDWIKGAVMFAGMWAVGVGCLLLLAVVLHFLLK